MPRSPQPHRALAKKRLDGGWPFGEHAQFARIGGDVGRPEFERFNEELTHVYAIISDGGHQYKVEEGQTFEVQLKDIPENARTFDFDRVLLVGDVTGGPKVGRPTVPGAKVSCSVVDEIMGDKITIQKFRRRKNSSLKKGHRQQYLRLKVEKITS